MAPAAKGTPEAWPGLSGGVIGGDHHLPVRVYFEDTDFTGVVYHAAFVRFLERGRSDFLRLSGIDHRALAAPDVGEPLFFTLRDLTLRFHAPARIDDLVVVTTRIAEMTGARIVMAQTVRRDDHRLVTGRVELVIVNADGRPRRLPPSLLRAMPAANPAPID